MNDDIRFILRLITKEVWLHRRLVVLLYLMTAVGFGVLAWYWPQVYTSSATVIIEDKNILKPLMEGTAVTQGVTDPVKMAKQIMSSRTTIKEIIEKGHWFSYVPDPEEIDTTIENIRSRTELTNKGKNIIEISYHDKSPTRAFSTAKAMTDIFIRESQLTKQKQSREAFEFIDSQATVYHKKLKGAEQAIKDFRSKNVDATPAAKTLASERILALKRQIEDVDIEISGLQTKLKAQKDQLSGEGGTENTASFAREATLRTRVTELKAKLEELRLVYQDTYPDIVQLLGQIESTKKEITEEILSRSGKRPKTKKTLANSPVAMELRSQMLITTTDISTQKSKKKQLEKLLDKERDKINKINMVEAQVAELNRDYKVNKAKYDELIEQRENARISMNIDIAKQGSTARIEEYASIPANPKGLRFIHFIIAGLILSFAIPLGLLYAYTILDQKVRDSRIIKDKLQLPILATIHPVASGLDIRQRILKVSGIIIAIISSWVLYGYEIMLHSKV